MSVQEAHSQNSRWYPLTLNAAALSGLTGGIIAALLDFFGAQGVLATSGEKAHLLVHALGRLGVCGAVLGSCAALLLELETKLKKELVRARRLPEGFLPCAAVTPFLTYISFRLWSGGMMTRLPGKLPLTLLTAVILIGCAYAAIRAALKILAWSQNKNTPLFAVVFSASGFLLLGYGLRSCDAHLYRRLYLYLHSTLGVLTVGCFSYAARLLLSRFLRPAAAKPLTLFASSAAVALWLFSLSSFQERQSIKAAAWEKTATLADFLRHFSTAGTVAVPEHREPDQPFSPTWSKPLEYDGKLPASPGTHILLITIDALRADRLGVYGYQKHKLSENIDRFAETEGVVFERAYCSAPHSSFSITSLHTSRFTHDEAMLAQDLKHPTMAEVFQSLGYRTLAFYTQGIFYTEGDQVGYYRRTKYGFETSLHGAFSAEEFTDRAIEAIDHFTETNDNRPSFIWTHYFNVHEPYNSTRFGDSSEERYLGEIYESDTHVIRLIRHARARLKGELIIVLTADHGEEFKDHGGYYHGSSLYEEQVRVPLIIHIPGAKPRRVRSPVSLVDVAPTLLSAVGALPPTSMIGRDLRKELYQGDSETLSRSVFASVMRHHMVLKWPWKLIADPSRDIYQLYHLERDPGEKVNKYDEFRQKAKELQGEIYRQLDEIVKSSNEVHTALNLGRMRDPRAVPGLLSLALNTNVPEKERIQAIDLLSEISDLVAIDTLKILLDDTSVGIATASALALGSLGDMSGLDLMLEALNDDAPEIRDSAALVLGKRGEPEASPALVEALGRDDVKIREDVIRTLGHLADPSTVPALIEALEEERTRYLVVLALGKIGDSRALGPLTDIALHDRHPDVRGYAIVGLGWLGLTEAIPSLVQVLREQPEIKWTTESLVRLGAVGKFPLFGTDARQGLPTLVRGFGECVEKPNIVHGEFLGRTLCRTTGGSVQLRFFANAPGDATALLRVRHLLPNPLRKVTLSIAVDDTPLQDLDISGDFQEFRLRTPPGIWAAGRHKVTLERRPSVPIELDHFLILADKK